MPIHQPWQCSVGWGSKFCLSAITVGAYVDVEVSGILSLSSNSVTTLIPGMVRETRRDISVFVIYLSVHVSLCERMSVKYAIVLVCKCVNFFSVVTNVRLENKLLNLFFYCFKKYFYKVWVYKYTCMSSLVFKKKNSLHLIFMKSLPCHLTDLFSYNMVV